MRILIVTPAGARSRYGNRNTAARWATLLRSLGHRVTIQVAWNGDAADAMIALHARRSHDSIRRFAAHFPGRPLIVALTGTDLYRDIRVDADARESMRLATRMIVLQEMGLKELSPALRRKTRVIYQSTQPVARRPPLKSCFEITVSGHLREEKDPFRAAAALAWLPAASRIRLSHLGGAMSPDMAVAAREWTDREPRYRWLGELTHGKALGMLARSRLMIISSRMEGGANIVSEALAAGVPIIASRIPGNIGMLGTDYAGYYPLGNEKALSRLMWRAESDPAFYRRLKRQCAARKRLVSPRLEQTSLKRLLAELT
ncbi:MAG TPA: selenoneine biosynthesis selenosugar synthase SenB [Burkholderiales bacterium]|nr:selenoneine biosynthesis selenosugar synthase SenB [Burkholderiales bacterium]